MKNVAQSANVLEPSLPGFDEHDPRWKLVLAILSSRIFTKSARLSAFLRYIARCTLEGRTEDVNEQQIGMWVFNRSLSGGSGDDSIVRTQARLLRLKLEEYFASECPDSPLIVRIPKGSYVPVFESRRVEPHVVPAASPEPEATHSTPPRARWRDILTMIALVLACCVFGILLPRRPVVAPAVPAPAQAPHALWSRLWNSSRETVIVPSDDTLVFFQEITRTHVYLDDYLSGDYIEKALAAGYPVRLSATWLNAHQYTSIADLNIATQLQRLPEAASTRSTIRYARDLRMDDLRAKNAVLIGGIGANPWVELFQNQLSFDVNYNWKTNEGYVANKSPHPGELAAYRESSSLRDAPDGVRRNYGVLAFLPGVGGSGNVLLIEGTGMAGTESAADFASDPVSFGRFLKTIGATDGRLPHFEVLLETTSIGGSAPQATVAAYRVLAP